ncbi:hypothetical protein SIO70_25665 [Chitinophaga sancti]|uniref:hypothetical protein n=1 Tax=Chitinophaga sancti TaxID=1004 RepID=UPI002A74BB2F|nr:hypothetical protein [Chitinophaga sancti]WPQ61753.1 hypothetical protein SIO70_25665 [Chitinophaga sancti]
MEPKKYKIRALRDWVPQKAGFVVLALVALVCQFSNPTYLSIMGDVVGANQFYREDLSFAFQVSMISLTMMFPVLWKIKAQFSSYSILMFSLFMLAGSMFLCAMADSVLLLCIGGFGVGIFKMLGTFEALSSVMLIVTPKANFKIWFTVMYTFILLCVQASGMLAVYLNDDYGWQYIYYVIIFTLLVVMLLVVIFFRPIEPIPQQLIQYIDWKGCLLWTTLLLLMAYVLIYGQVDNWLDSPYIAYATCGIFIVAGLLYYSYRLTPHPYVPVRSFSFRNVKVSFIVILVLMIFLNTSGSILGPYTGAIMKLDSLTNINLNLFVIYGILIGLVYCLFWYFVYKGGFKGMFFTGFLSLTVYHLLIYIDFSWQSGEEILFLPYFLRGFGNIVIYASVAVYMMKDVSFDIFPGTLFVVAVARNAIGGAVASSILSNLQHHKVIENIQKLALRIEANSYTSTTVFQQAKNSVLMRGGWARDAEIAASGGLYGKVYLQSVLLSGSEIFGYVIAFGALVLCIILLYHFLKPLQKKMFNNVFGETV